MRQVLCCLPEGPRGIEPHLLTMTTCLGKQAGWVSIPMPLPEGPESTSPNQPLVLESSSQSLPVGNPD